MIKPFEDLDVIDDFLMNALASDEEVGEPFCRTLIRGLLQRELEIVRISVQRVIGAKTPGQRGIRMDVEILEAQSEGGIKTIYDIEPNKVRGYNLPKHNRFYQAKIDARNLDTKDKTFRNLPNLFVITITDYDPFGYNQRIYTVHNTCEEVEELEYEDGLCFLYFNTTGTEGGSESVCHLLKYLQDSKMDNVTDTITKELHDCVSQVKKNPELRGGYMTLEEKIYYECEEAKAEGRAEGKAEGEHRFSVLMNKLLLQGRIEEAQLATTDAEVRKNLYAEFGIGQDSK